MTRLEQHYLDALQKRADWLEARCAIAAEQGRRLSYDEQELAALKWAIGKLAPVTVAA